MGEPADLLAEVCDAGSLAPATGGDQVCGMPARLVCRPGSPDELAAVLGACAGHGWRVVPRGAGTKLAWGAAPDGVEVIVETTRLNRVLEHAAGDLVVRVQAGVRYDDLQRTLGAAGQRIALDPPHRRGTLGGIVAACSSGPLRLGYGTPRDLLIGVTVALADGTLARSGGKVVKNVAGYDLGKLYCGSFGTLGVITEAVFRLHPVPAAAAYLTVELAGADEVAAAVRRLRAAQLVPAALEVERAAPGFRLTVLFEGVAPGVEARAQRGGELLGAARAKRPGSWGRLPEPAGELLLKIVAEPGAVDATLAAAERVLGDLDPAFELRGSAGVNVLYAGARCPATPDVVRAAVARLRAALADRDGSVVVLEAPPQVRQGLDVWGPATGVALMRRIKDEFDPGRVLAPGRFVGGI